MKLKKKDTLGERQFEGDREIHVARLLQGFKNDLSNRHVKY
jgi:hypothetical protein